MKFGGPPKGGVPDPQDPPPPLDPPLELSLKLEFVTIMTYLDHSWALTKHAIIVCSSYFKITMTLFLTSTNHIRSSRL